MTVLAELQKLIRCEGYSYSSYEVMGLVKQAATEIEQLKAECFKLAANQCHAGIAGEHGDHQCGEVNALRGTLREVVERLEYGQIAEPHTIACAAIGLGDRKTPDHDLFFLEAMAFREALENYACPGIGKCTERVMKDGTCIKETTGGCGNPAAEALADYPHFLAKPEPR